MIEQPDVEPVDQDRPHTGGESQGGAYPNPHEGKSPRKEGFMGSGGQTEMPYHGTGQLGEDKVGGNANSPAKSDG